MSGSGPSSKPKRGGVGGGPMSSRGRPSPASSSSFGESRMQRTESGSKISDRPMVPPPPPAEHPVPDMKMIGMKQVMDNLSMRYQSAQDRSKQWLDMPESAKKSKKQSVFIYATTNVWGARPAIHPAKEDFIMLLQQAFPIRREIQHSV